jgi:hypothetical protein
LAEKDSFSPLREKLTEFESPKDRLDMLDNLKKTQSMINSLTEGWDRLLSVEAVAQIDENVLRQFLLGTINMARTYLDISDTFATEVEKNMKSKMPISKTMAI